MRGDGERGRRGGQGGIKAGRYEKKQTKRDCGIRERKKNKSGRRRERGMTFIGRRRDV